MMTVTIEHSDGNTSIDEINAELGIRTTMWATKEALEQRVSKMATHFMTRIERNIWVRGIKLFYRTTGVALSNYGASTNTITL
jgi:phosphoribosyl-AMP cyclohydrolase